MKVYYGHIDELILPTIEILNEKGYDTAACCSGHANAKHRPVIAYILFEFGGMTPESLPREWQYVSDSQMEYSYTANSPVLLSQEITDAMNHLYIWALSLPDTTL